MALATTPASRPSRATSIGSETAWPTGLSAPTEPSTNLEALSTFIASLRPTFICDSSNGESRPGRDIAARHRTASAPYFSSTSEGTTALPLDFDIFLRSGSRMKPEISAWVHGAAWFS